MTTIAKNPSSGSAESSPVRSFLIITEMQYQAIALQRLLAEMGNEATLAVGAHAGLAHLSLSRYDTVVVDVDLGYGAVDDVATHLRRHHPDSNMAILVGWWDERTADMRSYSDLLIYKPVHPQQLRETFEGLIA